MNIHRHRFRPRLRAPLIGSRHHKNGVNMVRIIIYFEWGKILLLRQLLLRHVSETWTFLPDSWADTFWIGTWTVSVGRIRTSTTNRFRTYGITPTRRARLTHAHIWNRSLSVNVCWQLSKPVFLIGPCVMGNVKMTPRRLFASWNSSINLWTDYAQMIHVPSVFLVFTIISPHNPNTGTYMAQS